MPYFYERHQSRNFDLGKAVKIDRELIVFGTPDETTAYSICVLGSPIFYDGLVRSSIRGDYQGGEVWYVTLTYENIDPQHALGGDGTSDAGGPGGDGGNTPAASSPSSEQQELTSSFTFDTSAQTEHITQSEGTRLKKSASGFTADDATELQANGKNNTLDNQRAIGLTENGIQGIDRFIGKFEWSREVVWPRVTTAYLKTLRSLTGRMNQARFYFWDEGDVLFMGATGQQDNGRWRVSYRFAVEETRIDFPIGNGITIVKKRGHDIVHVVYGARKRIGNFVVPIPTNAYVEQIYKYGDFSLLEIGG